MVRSDFSVVPGVTPDTPLIGLLWFLWDLLLIAVTTIICWLTLERYGPRRSVAFSAGTLVWVSVFVLLWLGVHNMGLATPRILAVALPLAWLELVAAGFLVSWRMSARGLQN
jgi:heme A synthase